jgi:hypothetical protein
MSTIVTRAGKGSALTHNEVDANFVNLNTDKAEKTVANTFTANQIVSVTDNTNAALRITQLGTGNALLVEDSTNPDASPFVIDSAGRVGFGATPPADTNFRLNYTTSSAVSYVIDNQFTIANTNTTEASGFRSVIYTQAAAFTLINASHFSAVQAAIGAGSAVTTQSGFRAEASLTGATNNYGFYGDIASGTNRFNLYMNGTADNYIAGRLGIGTTSVTDSLVPCSINPTGATTVYGFRQLGTVQSGVTANWIPFQSSVSTAAAAFTLTNVQHFQANQGTIGATSAVTTQTGFLAASGLTGATNNFGFYGTIASGANRYNLYMAGTADNYMAGSLGIGTTPIAGQTLLLNKNITGSINSTQVRAQGVVQSDVTSSSFSFDSVVVTAAAAFTLTNYTHFNAQQVIIGAGSAVTSQFGFFARSSLTGATNNYGFYGQIASGTGRFNLYMAGTAANYFAGDLTVYGGTAIPAGGTTGSGYKFSSTTNFGVFFGSGAPTLSAAKGSLYLRSDGTTTNNRMYVNTDGATTWTAVTTAA